MCLPVCLRLSVRVYPSYFCLHVYVFLAACLSVPVCLSVGTCLSVCPCRVLQCVPQSLRCDGVEDCLNGADERDCGLTPTGIGGNPSPPVIVDFTGTGSFTARPLPAGHDSDVCPETHFRCPGIGSCLPVFVRCNKVNDCPGLEDEASCDVYQCPGFYRCRYSRVCVHPSHLCDGVFQCPQHDDELLCAFSCPQTCLCYGQAFFCTRSFSANDYPELRFLDAKGSGMKPVEIRNNIMLIYVGLGNCKLTDVQELSLLANLRSLDLSENSLTSLSIELSLLRSLHWLSLAGNPLGVRLFSDAKLQLSVSHIQTLDLSRVVIPELNSTVFRVFPDLQVLNLSHSGVSAVAGDFQIPRLHKLDLRGCSLSEFPRSMLTGLEKLRTVYSDDFKLCCPAALPAGFNAHGCTSPVDVVSSCESLLRSRVHSVFVSVAAALALLGNLACFVFLVANRQESNVACVAFMKHLCVSDGFMGVYLAVIGVANRLYEGTYLWSDIVWTKSVTCKAAGFLSLLSSEMSAFIVFLIALDRLLVVRFPIANRFFDRRLANRACVALWSVAVLLAAMPLTSQWRVYGYSAICISLPFGEDKDDNDPFSFGVRIVLNCTLLVLAGVQQVLVLWSLEDTKTSVLINSNVTKDHVIAHRMITTFAPTVIQGAVLGVFGLLSSTGVSTSSEIGVAIAILLVPLQSALKPLCHLLAVVQEGRRQERVERVRRALTAQLRHKQAAQTGPGQLRAVTEKAQSLLTAWLTSGLVSTDQVRLYLAESRSRVE